MLKEASSGWVLASFIRSVCSIPVPKERPFPIRQISGSDRHLSVNFDDVFFLRFYIAMFVNDDCFAFTQVGEDNWRDG